MIIENLVEKEYQSREAQLFFLKQKADKVSDFIRGLRRAKSKVYLQIMAEVTGNEAVVTLNSFLLQVSLYCRKYDSQRMNTLLETGGAHRAIALYLEQGDFSELNSYLKEIKQLFELVTE